MAGFTVHGVDVGKWLAPQQKPEVWAALTEGQRERLEAVGINPPTPTSLAPVETDEPAEPTTAPVSAFERGVATWVQKGPAPAL